VGFLDSDDEEAVDQMEDSSGGEEEMAGKR